MIAALILFFSLGASAQESLSNMSEAQYHQILDSIIGIYQPDAQSQGATIVSRGQWSDSSLKAFSVRRGIFWEINISGGLARRPEITADAFALAACHEIGHLKFGFDKESVENFMTNTCAKRIFGGATVWNTRFAQNVPSDVAEACARDTDSPEDRSLCYRIAAATRSLDILRKRNIKVFSQE